MNDRKFETSVSYWVHGCINSVLLKNIKKVQFFATCLLKRRPIIRYFWVNKCRKKYLTIWVPSYKVIFLYPPKRKKNSNRIIFFSKGRVNWKFQIVKRRITGFFFTKWAKEWHCLFNSTKSIQIKLVLYALTNIIHIHYTNRT